MLDLIVRCCEVVVLAAIAAAIVWQVAGGIRDLHGRHRAGLARLRRHRDLELDLYADWLATLERRGGRS